MPKFLGCPRIVAGVFPNSKMPAVNSKACSAMSLGVVDIHDSRPHMCLLRVPFFMTSTTPLALLDREVMHLRLLGKSIQSLQSLRPTSVITHCPRQGQIFFRVAARR